MVSSRAFAAASLIAVLGGACGFDEESLPDPRGRKGPAAGALDPGREMPLERVSLILAADSGNVDLIAVLRENATEIRWEEDGPVAMQFAARRGYLQVVRMLAGYGVCGEGGESCAKALAEAKAKGHEDIVAFLLSLESP